MLHSWSMPSCLHHLLSSLLNGAALLPFDARTGDAGLLARWLREERVTVYHSIPAVFRQMAEALSGDERFPDLRAIVLSAAPTSPREVELFRRHFAAGAVLFNMMGTTETGWVRGGRIDASLDVTRAGVPVGYPVPDKEVLLLDEQGREVESGNVGEIAVRSRYLASGYWRQPELTAARFSPGRDGAEQVYRTGDMGRMEADGCLFHLGRMDYQVKVRGFRVEIGEVERALLAHPVVEQAVAVGRPVAGADTRLVAYVVPAAGRTLTATELRRHMKDRLPDYMVPADFVPLASLPCTPNGKLDYAALPDPDRVRPELGTAYAAPATELERIIVPMWEELLQRDRVGVHDNFFDLGGDSLLLTLLQRRLLAELGEEMPLVQMFDHPTITAMVRYLRPSEDGSVPADKEGDRLDSMRVGRARLARLAGRRNAREVE
jgi:acyl-coenzyme A synthetase/AMP-(fatty) acid ligase